MNTRSLAYFLLLIACVLAGCVSYHAPEAHREAQPKIYPDYAGVTFPINIAPPNFVIRDDVKQALRSAVNTPYIGSSSKSLFAVGAAFFASASP